ncbi:ABC transporter ATP-binding protein [Clostridiaceae bacterium M8S5]|nr:ABC transporter ATP-binding protein [Clostridiaceae bacterium M8S5]
MVKIENVSFFYEDIDNKKRGIKNINLHIKKGECVVLCGVSGCGKTTLTRLINGLIPNFYKGELTGDIIVNGEKLKDKPISKTSKLVGSVFQEPATQFFNVDTTSELAFGCENQGMDVTDILKRIEDAKEVFKLHNLINRSIFNLSGGEKQRIACGSVYATYPEIVVLDEPSSSLDADSIKRLSEVIEKFKEMGKTIIISEHRIHYLKHIADKFVYMRKGEVRQVYLAKEFLKLKPEFLSELGLRTLDIKSLKGDCFNNIKKTESIKITNLAFSRKKNKILDIKDLKLYKNEIVALVGHNGAGKTTFAHCLCGLLKHKGSIYQGSIKLNNKQRVSQSFMVMQNVNSQLFTESVKEEITLKLDNVSIEAVEETLNKLGLSKEIESHPMALSGGQKQRVAIASAAMANKDILIYDEPTSGLDYQNMGKMSKLIDDMKEKTHCTIIITHDPEFILKTCHRIIHLENGSIKDCYALDKIGIEKIKDYFRN